MKKLLSLSDIIAHDGLMRTIAKAQVIELLVLGGFAFEVKAEGRALARKLASQALDAWVLAGLPYSLSAQQEELFDPAEVINFMKWASLSMGDSFWTNYFVPTGQRLFQSTQPTSETQTAFKTAQFAFRRTFYLVGVERGKKMRLRLPLAQNQSSDLTVKLHFFDGQDVFTDISLTSQRVEFMYQHIDRSCVYAEYQFNLDQADCDDLKLKNEISDQERLLYTSPNEGFIQVTDQIKRLASAIANQRTTSQAVAAIWDWMIDSFFLGVVHYHLIDLPNLMDSLLKKKIIDCQLGAALLISLCRALDIPARIIGGYLLYPLAPTQHYWAQVWIAGQGWCSYDLMAWDLSAGNKQQNWCDIFKGQVDARIITEIFPRSIIGNVGLTYKGGMHRLMRSTQSGIVIEYLRAASGSLLYRDEITSTLSEIAT